VRKGSFSLNTGCHIIPSLQKDMHGPSTDLHSSDLYPTVTDLSD